MQTIIKAAMHLNKHTIQSSVCSIPDLTLVVFEWGSLLEVKAGSK